MEEDSKKKNKWKKVKVAPALWTSLLEGDLMLNRGRGWLARGRGRGGKFEGVSFKCGMQGHMAFECSKILKDARRQEGRIHIVEVELAVATSSCGIDGRAGRKFDDEKNIVVA
jgi:hypothetical protein